jgi:hypothetical protein
VAEISHKSVSDQGNGAISSPSHHPAEEDVSRRLASPQDTPCSGKLIASGGRADFGRPLPAFQAIDGAGSR